MFVFLDANYIHFVIRLFLLTFHNIGLWMLSWQTDVNILKRMTWIKPFIFFALVLILSILALGKKKELLSILTVCIIFSQTLFDIPFEQSSNYFLLDYSSSLFIFALSFLKSSINLLKISSLHGKLRTFFLLYLYYHLKGILCIGFLKRHRQKKEITRDQAAKEFEVIRLY